LYAVTFDSVLSVDADLFVIIAVKTGDGAVGVKTGYEVENMKHIKIKVKVTPVQALRLCTGRKAHRGSRGIALPFHDHGTRKG